MDSQKKFVVKHHLDQLSPEDLAQYLRDVSTFIGLDPDLNGLDTIWLDNETGIGRTLVPYAKRGTAEILRNIYYVDVSELSHAIVKGSIVFTAAGTGDPRKNGVRRVERAVGSKYIEGLTGRALDNAIMTASTRALRRLTMQFTTLGILDESEVVDIVGQPANPAAGATLAGSPAVIPPQPQVLANNQPGKEQIAATTEAAVKAIPTPPVYPEAPVSAQVSAFHSSAYPGDVSLKGLPIPPGQEADAEAATKPPIPYQEPTESVTSEESKADKKTDKKPRKKKNTVSLEVEPEVVNKAPEEPIRCLDCKKPLNEHPLVNSARVCPDKMSNPTSNSKASNVAAVLTGQSIAQTTAEPDSKKLLSLPSVLLSLPSVPPSASVPPPPQPSAQPQADVSVASAAGMPSKEQMDTYRKAIGVYTQQLPATPGLGSVQRMRTFITKMSDGVAPQNMTVVQWEKMIAWFNDFVGRNRVDGLITYIGDVLGDVPKK